MTRKKHILLRMAVAAALIAMAGCTIEPVLHLRKAIATKIALSTRVNVDVMWQIDWQTQWEFNWDVSALGPVGYRLPSSMRMHVFTQGEDGKPISHTVHNFVGDNAQVDVFVGTHNILFHNNDSEALLFRQDNEFSDIESYTRKIANGLKSATQIQTLQQKTAGLTKADGDQTDIEGPVNLTPEGLFTLYKPDQVITDNLDDYVYEDGKYVLKLEGELHPATFIYLFQIKLANNDDRVIGSNGGAALTGMSQGVNLMTGKAWDISASYLMDVYMDKAQNMLGARVMTFGIPGCDPYDATSVASAPDGPHYLVINVTYVNGSSRNISIPVTDEIRALPTGGVITLEIDVDDFPPDESAGGGGGFNALVGDWEEEEGSTTIIN